MTNGTKAEPYFDQTAPGVGVGDIAHLLIGDIQKLCQLLPVRGRLIEHDDELRVGKHGAGLHGIQQIFHVLGDGRWDRRCACGTAASAELKK